MSAEMSIQGGAGGLNVSPEDAATIAKYVTYGISASAICASFNLSAEEFGALQIHPIFMDIQAKLQGETANRDVETDEGWDSIEHKALDNLKGALKYNKDPDLNLRVAAVANKAQRRVRNNPRVLDGNQGTRIPLDITQRLVQKFSNGDTIAQETTVRMNLDMLNSKGRPDLSAVNNALGRKRVKNEVVELPDDPPQFRHAKTLFDIVFDDPIDS